MKIKLSVLAVFAAVTFISPMVVFLLQEGTVETGLPAADMQVVLLDEAGSTQTADLNRYLRASLAAQASSGCPTEAMRAMAVVLRTYAVSCMQSESGSIPFSGDIDAGNKEIDRAIAATQDKILTYDNKAIVPAFHSVSSGTTNSALEVWGQDLPYLVNVSAVCDLLADDYMQSVCLTPSQVQTALGDEVTIFDDDPALWFGGMITTSNGLVSQVQVCDVAFTGLNLQQKLGLASPCFTVSFQNGNFVFDTLGSGHGLGLSKNAAMYMAKEGKTAEEILAVFYPQTQLQNISDVQDADTP